MDIWIFLLVLILIGGITSLFLLRDKPPSNTHVQDASGTPVSAKGTPTDPSVTTGKDSQGCPDPNKLCPPPMIFMDDHIEKPFAKKGIMDVDDYEYSMVFKNEGDRAITKQMRDKLMSQYPMDWTVQPPSSESFQQGMAAYKESFENPPPAPKFNLYASVDGTSMTPPDMTALEQKELEVLQRYTPKDPKSLTTYDAADAKEIIERIYAVKGLKAEYKETAPNQFTVFSTRPIDEQPVFEDEEDHANAQATSGANTQANENTIVIPTYVKSSLNAGLDPFYTPGEKTRDGAWDYTSWTPGLERMFAPNAPLNKWY